MVISEPNKKKIRLSLMTDILNSKLHIQRIVYWQVDKSVQASHGIWNYCFGPVICNYSRPICFFSMLVLVCHHKHTVPKISHTVAKIIVLSISCSLNLFKLTSFTLTLGACTDVTDSDYPLYCRFTVPPFSWRYRTIRRAGFTVHN